ncbi:MAG: hypothetical protein QW818_02480 [Candidatus Aenigmatarchaeota archaeon]
MPVLKDMKKVGGGFRNEVELVRVVYDYTLDGGAVGNYDVLTAESPCVVTLRHAAVKTAVTSSGSMTIDLGKGVGGTEFFNNKPVASLTLDSLHLTSAPAAVRLAPGDKVVMALETAPATAGKLEMVFEVTRY